MSEDSRMNRFVACRFYPKVSEIQSISPSFDPTAYHIYTKDWWGEAHGFIDTKELARILFGEDE